MKAELFELVLVRGEKFDVVRASQQTVREETTHFGPVNQVSLGRVRELA